MRSKLASQLIVAGLLLIAIHPALAQRKPNPAFAKVTDEPGLPRVLLIGDSISIGYTVDVQQMLKGKANVHRIPTNGGPTTRGLESIDAWLGDSKWNVIHFNWGLHDLKYMNDKGQLVEPSKGHQQVPIDEYKANLEKLVQRLEKTGAKLIWRNTTPVPPGAQGRVVGDSARYNEVAKEIMEKHNITIDDHFDFVKPRMDELMRPANVHFTPEGSKELAKLVTKAVLAKIQE